MMVYRAICILLLLSACNERRERVLFVRIPDSVSIQSRTSVILNGKHIGDLKHVDIINGSTLLQIQLNDFLRIPKPSTIKYYENILGGGYVSIDYDEKSVNGSYRTFDTLVAKYEVQKIRLDSTSIKIVVKKLEELKNELDTTARTDIVKGHFDTLLAKYEAQSLRLDSTSIKIVIKKLEELKKLLDTIARTDTIKGH
jgi:hypothetical protein